MTPRTRPASAVRSGVILRGHASGEATVDSVVGLVPANPSSLTAPYLHHVVAVGNLLLRIGFALSIVGAAIGMTAAASDSVARCDATLAVSASDSTASCAPVESVAPAVAGYQAAPVTADRAPVAAAASTGATLLVLFATGIVFFTIFAILFSNRLRPGGVRTPHR